jgi:hypothetical protein
MESSRLQGYANPNTQKFQFHLKQDNGTNEMSVDLQSITPVNLLFLPALGQRDFCKSKTRSNE